MPGGAHAVCGQASHKAGFMPIEKRPSKPVPKGAPHGSRTPPHKVSDNETFESVARKYGVPEKQLIQHNFGTMDPAELNWYLREYVGCTLPTHDRKNWRFSNSARPGLIYIPQKVIQLDAITIVGHISDGKTPPPTVNLAAPGRPDFIASEKFVFEFKFPPTGDAVDVGYFLARAKFSVEGELKQQGGTLKVSLKKGEVKLAVEKKLNDDTKAAFAVKVLDEKTLTRITEAVRSGSTDGFRKALAEQFEGTIKTTYRWGNITLEPEAGLEVSKTPLILRLTGGYEDSLFLDGAPFTGKFAVKGSLNVGLSVKGWAWVASKVGPQALKSYLVQGGRALVSIGEWLVSEAVLTAGAIAAGTVVGTLGLTYFCAWITQNARRKGELTGLASWYREAYIAKVFGEPRPDNFIEGDVQLRDQLVQLGEKDAVTDARAALSRMNNPAARGSDKEALEAFCNQIYLEANRVTYDAKLKLRLELEAKSLKLVGL
jgi:hypothetical protein